MNIDEIQWQCNKAIKYELTKGFTHPEGILKRGFGDCTDFALLKLDLAVKAGMKGYLLRCFIRNSVESHMLCIIEGTARKWIFGKKKPCFYVLDNLRDKAYIVFGRVEDDKELNRDIMFGGAESNTYTVAELRRMGVL